jgi:hypothetical protein
LVLESINGEIEGANVEIDVCDVLLVLGVICDKGNDFLVVSESHL